MRQVSLQHHKSWDRLCVYQVSWWINLIDWAFSWYRPAWEWDDWIWDKVLGYTHRKRRELYYVPLTPSQACEADMALFGKDAHLCWQQKEGH